MVAAFKRTSMSPKEGARVPVEICPRSPMSTACQQYLEDAAHQRSMDMNQPQGGRQGCTADDADQNRQSEQG